ncbi:MAG: DUF2341 domain-containing protein, partial [Nanoarchaeota archaeon]
MRQANKEGLKKDWKEELNNLKTSVKKIEDYEYEVLKKLSKIEGFITWEKKNKDENLKKRDKLLKLKEECDIFKNNALIKANELKERIRSDSVKVPVTKRFGISDNQNIQLKFIYFALFAFVLLMGLFFLRGGITGLLVKENLLNYNNPLNIEFSENGEYSFVIKEHPQNFNIRSLKASGKIFGEGKVKAYLEVDGKKYLIFDDKSLKENKINSITGLAIVSDDSELDISLPIENTTPEIINETESANESIENIEIPEEDVYINLPSENLSEVVINDTIEDVTNDEEIIALPEEVVEEIVEVPTETISENVTETIEEIDFSEACLDTCVLPSGINSTELKLIFEVEEGSKLQLTNIFYSLEDLTIVEELEFDSEIRDSNNELVEYDLEIEDAETKTVEVSEQIRKPQGLGVASKLKVKLKKGEYNVKISLKNSLIKSIEFSNLDLNSDLDKFINIDDPVEKEELSKYIKVYAIDPTAINFSNATVTVTATGTSLYKCKDWNFTRQSCYGSWELFKTGLVPGQDYTFILTPDDPGFGEINISNAQHLDENYTFISDIYDQVNTKDDTWSEAINVNEFVRVTYENELTNGNVIDVFVRNNNSDNTWFEVYNVNTTSPMLGSSGVIGSATGEWKYITLENVAEPTDTFDFKIMGDSSLEFDYIHDASSWWNNSYQYKKQLNITNNVGSTLPSGYSVNFTIDTTGANFQDDGDDLRIVYWNGTDNIELDRVNETAFNSTTTEIWFKTQADIPASSWNDSYYMYYGYSAAVNPLSNKSNVYEVWDDFTNADTTKSSGADVPYSPWDTELIGSMTGGSNISSNQVVLDCDSTGDFWSTSDNGMLLHRGGCTGGHSVSVKLISIDEGGDDYARHGLMVRNSLDANSANQALTLRREWATGNDFARFTRVTAGASTVNADYSPGISSLPIWLRLDFDGNVNGYVDRYYSTDGQSWTQILDTDDASSLSGTIYFGVISADASSAAKGTWDDFKLRKLVASEPTVSIGSEEETNNAPNITLNSPANASTDADGNVTFICNATDDNTLQNITLYVWNTTGTYYTNTTNISGVSNQSSWSLTNMPNEDYTWNCLAYDNASQSDWGDANWSLTIEPPATCNYKIKLTFDNSDSSENLTNFPAMVKLNSTKINYTKTSENDIRFYDSDESTLLNHHWELWNESGDSFGWVKVPQIDAGSTTDHAWVYYNCTSTTTQNESGTYDSNYIGVWHLKESGAGTAGEYKDSTAYGHNGQGGGGDTGQLPTQVDAKIGKGQNYDNTDVIVVPHVSTLNFSQVTYEAYVNSNSLATWRAILYKQGVTWIGLSSLDNPQFTIWHGGASKTNAFNSNTIPDSSYTYLAANDDGNGVQRAFINGNFVHQQDWSPQPAIDTSTNNLQIGRELASGDQWQGILDEIRISNTVRSDDWLNASYLTMSDQLISYGSEQTVNNAPNVTLSLPPNNYVNDTSDPVNITFECNATDDNGLANISLYITNSQNTSFALNQTTNITGISDSVAWTLSLANGNYTWNCLAYDSAGMSDWGDANRTLKINYSAPVSDSCGTLNSNKILTSDIITTGTCFIVNASNIVI